MDIDDEFREDKRSESGGRRASDVPTVPLREHLETLIRGVRTELHLEITDVAVKVEQFTRECRESWDKQDTRLHKLTGEVRGLHALEQKRQGGKEARAADRAWVQWIPSLIAVLIAAYVAFFA